MEFEEYLKQHLLPSTIKSYTSLINHFFLSIERKKINPKTASFSQILEYIKERRKHCKNPNSVNGSLHAIKKYYSYLVEIGERSDNPAKPIRLRDKPSRDIQVQDLFTVEELEQLLNRKERLKILKNRNLFIISLLIYQGLTNGEIKNLSIQDIDLKEATISIKSRTKTNSRTLKLNAKQMYLVMNYLNEDRVKLVKNDSQKLFITILGNEENGEGIHYIIESSKYIFPNKKLNPVTIRQSVICNLLKSGNDLRIVQAFAGHKHPTATENYKQTHLEELKNQILKFHPLSND